MRPKILLRISAVLLLLFAAGHSTGHLGRKNNLDAQGKEVIRQMEDYHFVFKGTSQTLDGHMQGYGIIISFILISLASLLWIVSSSIQEAPAFSIRVLIPILFFMMGNGWIAFRYFFLGPGIFSVLVCLLIIVSILLIRREKVK